MIEAINPNKIWFEFIKFAIWINLDSPSKARNQTKLYFFGLAISDSWALQICNYFLSGTFQTGDIAFFNLE